MSAKRQFTKRKQFVALGGLNVDAAYQDRPSQSHIRQMVDNFDLDAVGLIHVSERSDRSLWLVDGQHRVAALKEFLGEGWEKQHAEALVYTNLRREDEAWLYNRLNTIKVKRPFARFRSRLCYGEEVAVAIDSIAREHGFTVGDGPSTLSCVGALETIYAGARTQNALSGHLNLRRTLSVVAQAWGTKPPLPNGDTVSGIGLFLERFGAAVNTERLAKKLAEFPGGFSGLLGKARAFRDIEGGSVSAAVFELVRRSYNTRLSGPHLEAMKKASAGATA